MKYCLLGKKLNYSYSAIIHAKLGLCYELREVEKKDLEKFVKSNCYDGYNVTIPYKTDIISYLDEISEKAELIGSVNTVSLESGKRKGYNTDFAGLKYLFLRAGVSVKDKNVLILGSGGTFRTAACLMKSEGAKTVKNISRTGEINYDNCYEAACDTEIIINCTPVGTYPDVFDCPVDLSRFKKLVFVADCIYNPLKTALTLKADELGVKNSNGLSMLVFQALSSEEIWTGEKRTEKTEEVLRDLIFKTGNIVLFGMPSSGKSTVGRKVAETLGREFIDTDEEIFSEKGRTPAEIIERDGEKVFRDIETEVIKKLAVKTGAVISVGGGAVLRAENVNALKMNGTLVYLKRDLSLLKDENRPISKKTGIEKLYEQRKDAYEKVKDCEVQNDSTIYKAVKGVIKEYENSRYKRC